MSAPTPGDVYGCPTPTTHGRPARFFDPTSFGTPAARRRAAALSATVKALEETLAAARALFREDHLDLYVERYRRDVDRLDDVLQAMDDALADPAGPPPPPPTARRRP